MKATGMDSKMVWAVARESVLVVMETVLSTQGVEFTRRRAHRSDETTHKVYITLIVEASGFGKGWSPVSIAMVTAR